MIKRTCFPVRMLLGSIASIALSAAMVAPVSAQDAQLNAVSADVTVLKGKVTILETRVQSDHDAAIATKVQLDQALKDVATLKKQVVDQNVKIDALQVAVGELLKRQEDPSKPPVPQKPTDNQPLTLRAPFIVKDGSGTVIFKVEVAAGNMPRAIIGNPTGSRVELGIGAGGTSVVGLYDDSNKALSALVADPKGSYLRVKDNDQTTGLGKVEGSGVGLFMKKGDKAFGEVSADSKGFGIVKVFGTGGKPVGGLFAGTDGGGLALTGADGGKSAVSLGVTPTGGKVRVYAVGGGKTRAELVADGATGAVNVFDSDGATAVNVASVESKAGKIEIGNGLGDIVVQAGATKKGSGFVSTGPYDTGVAGSMLSVGKPASSLLGSMKSK